MHLSETLSKSLIMFEFWVVSSTNELVETILFLSGKCRSTTPSKTTHHRIISQLTQWLNNDKTHHHPFTLCFLLERNKMNGRVGLLESILFNGLEKSTTVFLRIFQGFADCYRPELKCGKHSFRFHVDLFCSLERNERMCHFI